jgi:hypothetical protein
MPGRLVIDLGANYWSDAPTEMKLDVADSRTVNIYYLFDFSLIKEKLTLNPGLGLGLDGYKFRNQNYLLPAANGELEVFDDPLAKKTKLAFNYVDVPLELSYRTNPGRNSVRVTVGAKVGVLFSSHQKIKTNADFYNTGVSTDETRKIKLKDDWYAERFRYGAVVRFGFGSYNFFYYRSLNNVFQEGALNQLNGENPVTNTFGITFLAL